MSPGDADRITRMLETLLQPMLGQLPVPLPGAVDRALQHLARERTGGDVHALLGNMIARHDAKALDALVTAATVTHTSFFRHPEHFEELRGWLSRRSGRVRIWSAGCATGEEAYTLALVAETTGRDYEILGTDVDPEALAVAQRGLYRAGPRGLSNEPRGAWRVPESMRRRVRFERASVAAPEPAPQHGAFDVIFCRNVLIYFDPDRVTTIIGRLRDRLFDHGVLVLGPVESLALLPPGLQRADPLGWLEQVRLSEPVLRRSTLPPWPRHVEAEEQSGHSDLETAARALSSGQSDLAETSLRALLEREPQHGEAWFLLAEALLQRGERQQARVAFERAAVHADPELGDALAAAAQRRARDCTTPG